MEEKEFIIKLLLTIIENENEKNIIKSFFNYCIGENKNYNNLKINVDIVNNLSKNKILLIALYLHIYTLLNGKNSLIDLKLKKIRSILNLTDEFTNKLNIYLKYLRKDSLNEKKPVEIIINPSKEFIEWANNVIYLMLRDGIIFEKKKLVNLNNIEYEHPLDRKALEKLENTSGLEFLVRKFNEYGLEKLMKINYMGSNIKVTKTNFPDIYKILCTVCEILDYNPIPDLYIEHGLINAKTMGSENPVIIITSSCIGSMTYDELLFVLGHEVGHIKSQHVLYHQIAELFPVISNVLGSITLGVGNIISTGLELALLNWRRKSEFTADRAGLLVCQNIDVAITTMMKIAGAPPKYYDVLNPDEFRKQAVNFEELNNQNLEKIAKFVSVLFDDHPWTVERAQELYKWVDSGEYEKILNRQQNISNLKDVISTKFKDKFCANCGNIYAINDYFCANCGAIRH